MRFRHKYASILRHRIKSIRDKINFNILKVCGLEVGKNCIMGHIICEWPGKIKIGDDCVIEDNVILKVTKPFVENNKILIGNNVFIGAGCQINCNTIIAIGNNTLIASNTIIVDTGHEIDRSSTINQQPLTLGEISIGEDVWVGAGCKILKNVKIGEGSIIGAGSVVNKSIPPYEIWAGSPAKFIKKR